MDYVEIELRDEELQESYMLKLSSTDVIKAKNDKVIVVQYSVIIQFSSKINKIRLIQRFCIKRKNLAESKESCSCSILPYAVWLGQTLHYYCLDNSVY